MPFRAIILLSVLTVLVGAVTLWFARAKEHWDGPSRAIIEFVLESQEK